MTDTSNNPSPSKPPRAVKGEILWIVVAFLVAGGLFLAAFWPPIHDQLLSMIGNTGPSQERIEAAERKIQALDARINTLETRIDNMPATPPAPPTASVPLPTPASAVDLAHIQSDMTELATALGNLQNQVKQSGATVHASTQMAMAKIVAFMQLRDAAASGRGFSMELDAMRAAAKEDPAFKEPFEALTPYVEKGAPDMASLRAQLDEQTGAAEVATAKAGAQTWWERILAEFRGLVLVRPLHEADEQDSALVAMKSALAQNDLDAALNAMKHLPPDAQKVFEDWRKKAEARQTVDDALRMIADRLVAGSDAAVSAPSGQDKAAP